MTIVAAGSIATDHLMSFPGRFADQLVPGELEHISLSFLADDLQIRRGGVAANIAFGLGALGQRPVLVGAVGVDFADYRAWLDAHGVNTAYVQASTTRHSARFVCTTDTNQNQLATFYAGAMSEASEIDLGAIVDAVGDVELVVISPDDPTAMLGHTRYCREHDVPFAADPSQQMARMDGSTIAELVDGARYLFTNAYEAELLQQKTDWTTSEILSHVDIWICTHGADGLTIRTGDIDPIHLDVVPAESVADPTGVGDAFRAGFLTGRSAKLSLIRSAQLGAAMAVLAVETVGTQEYELDPDVLLSRLRHYGAAAASDVEAALLATTWSSTPELTASAEATT